MKAVVQRVAQARVVVDGETVGAIERGLLILVGVERGDSLADASALALKLAGLRVFPGEKPMDRSVGEIGGSALVISQFTLVGTVHKGRRPSFDLAEDPGLAEGLYLEVAARLREQGIPTQLGRFGAHMQVELVNDGPVTILINTAQGRVL